MSATSQLDQNIEQDMLAYATKSSCKTRRKCLSYSNIIYKSITKVKKQKKSIVPLPHNTRPEQGGHTLHHNFESEQKFQEMTIYSLYQ